MNHTRLFSFFFNTNNFFTKIRSEKPEDSLNFLWTESLFNRKLLFLPLPLCTPTPTYPYPYVPLPLCTPTPMYPYPYVHLPLCTPTLRSPMIETLVRTLVNTLFSKTWILPKNWSSSIQPWDSNSWQCEHESSPITTRPDLRPSTLIVCLPHFD